MTTKIIRPVEIVEPVFSRASTALYQGITGQVLTAAVNERRPVYVGGVQTGWLLEPAATNLITYSAAFDNAAWSKSIATVTANAATAPDGTATADRMLEQTASQQHLLIRSPTLVSSSTYTWSVWAKAVGDRTLRLVAIDKDNVQYVATFDLVNGVTIANDGGSATATSSISAPVAGFRRCSITFSSGAGGTAPAVRIGSGGPTGQASFTGVVTSGLDLWEAQLELGGLTSNIPTGAAAATRAAEAYTGTGRDLVSTNAVETEVPWLSTTSYAVGARVLRNTVGRIFLNKIAGIDATVPELAPTRWEDVGPGNRMAMFDKEVGSVTTATGSIVAVLRPGAISGLALQEMSNANQVHVVMTGSPGGVVVYDRTLDLEFSQVLDAYDWFFLPYDARTDAQLTDLPEFPDCEVTVTISGSGTVSCGLLALGTSVELGDAEFGATLGILNRSVITTNAYGRTTITKRGYHRTMDLKVWVPSNGRNRFYRFLADIKDTPCVYIGDDSDGNEALIVYGTYRDFSIVLSFPGWDLYNVRVEGMTL